jgi:DNA primase
MSHYPSDFLKMIRNQIPIDKVITTLLNMELHGACKRLRFRCPLCCNFHTATNPKINLARCFDCKENFNPIDLVMAVGNLSFIEAVEYLKNECGNLR